MVRQIIHIDEEKCIGCGKCAEACHEGAIAMVDGKAKLMRDDYCDGLGDCLPSCPTNAITFTKREAAAYDEEAVAKHLENRKKEAMQNNAGSVRPHFGGCPGQIARAIQRNAEENNSGQENPQTYGQNGMANAGMQSQLSQWPVQIKLAPVRSPYFDGADLLIAADCTAYAYGNFHNDFIKGKKVIIGCPKLDMTDYSEKLTEIIKNNDIKGITIVRMEVPCCGGIEQAAITAMKNSGKFLPWQVITISTDGRILR